MSRVFIHGLGAVSPAGWGMAALRAALAQSKPIPATALDRPGWRGVLSVRRAPEGRPPAVSHPRLRRSSSMSLFAAAAAREALDDAGLSDLKGRRLGIIFCVTGGCVQFSRRFYDEAWHNPATASPLLFPETVFNAPASHLSAVLETDAINYTLVGDPGAFLQALALAAQWLRTKQADACLVVGAEELDWVTADACRHFAHRSICAEGAAALVVSAHPARAELIAITDSSLYLKNMSRTCVIGKMRSELPPAVPGTLLCDSRQGTFRDAAETIAWRDWTGPRLSPRTILGDGLMAGAGWQCAAAIDALRRGQNPAAVVSAVDGHQQAIGALFSAHE